MRVAVTGASGFIGSHVVDALRAAGHNVVAIDLGRAPQRPDVEFADTDVLDVEAMTGATSGCEAVFHLAAVANVNDAFERPLECVRLNVEGTAVALEAARRNQANRFVLASTVWVYGATPGDDVDEESTFSPAGGGHIYTSTKQAAELLCHDYQTLYDVPFTILRYGIPYGPRMRLQLVLPIFIGRALRNEPISIAGDGSGGRNFLYVEDLARAHVLALRDEAANRTYNIDGGEHVSLLRMAKDVIAATGSQSEIVFTPARAGDYAGKRVSTERATTELGWRQEVPFEEGLRRTLAWYMDSVAEPALAR
jgi:UDP-glucose 4-epimerase